MSRRASFKQADAARALRAAVAAGLKPHGYSIAPDGSIRVEFGETAQTGNSFDAIIGGRR
ncbi:hypothetical protein OMW55_03720 [Sphingomonas sp. BN140010]|uniref:Uncharacterized protein n=1 Tax=Sphingomonas arvum TaxID=2992113 RepID=A0ABT3JCV9_9SPHN|nr:hypothetical protein [Sphingomonas sp. BN140010]MCW3796913.1 hypothetical protein [Sphingomonas sp. BN140010]